MAGTIQKLLGSQVFTSLPSMLGHLLNVAVAPHLTTTLVARTPFSPTAPLAIDNLFTQSARICPTWDGLTDGIVAWRSTCLGLTFDSPHTSLLPSSACGSAITPLFPISEFTILRWLSSASCRWTLAGIRIALINFLGCTKTPLTLATSIFSNTSGASLYAIASARAITPSTPIAKLTICVFGT